MAEKPDDTFESHDYPEYQEEENLPTKQEWMHNRLYNEPYKNYVTRQKLIESNRVNVKPSFLDGRASEVKQLKKNILRKILDIPSDQKIDETKFELKLKPIDNDSYEMYYKNMVIGDYNTKTNSITILSEDNFSLFRTRYFNEIQKRFVREI